MKKICMVDFSNTGHHWEYNSFLFNDLKEYSITYISSDLGEEKKIWLMERNIDFFELNYKPTNRIIDNFRKIYLVFKVLNIMNSRSIDKVLFLFLDDLIYQIAILKYLYKLNSISIFGTLHWYRDENNKEKFMRKLLKDKNITIITHTNYIKYKLKDIYHSKINLVNYPERKKSYTKFNSEENNKFKILYFGNTRIDKGIDILLNSLQYVECKFELTIAGKLDYIGENEIEKLFNAENGSLKIINKYIEESDIDKYFYNTDVVAIPYRKSFKGESGIFVKALTIGKPIVAPNIVHFPEVINKFKNGVIFEVENTRDLGTKLTELKKDYNNYMESASKFKEYFNEKHSPKKFVEKYREILNG